MPERCIGTDPMIAIEDTDIVAPAPAPKKNKPVINTATESACADHRASTVPSGLSMNEPELSARKPMRCKLAPAGGKVGSAAIDDTATMTPEWKGLKTSAS